MTKENIQNNMDDLIISINDIDVDIDAAKNLCEDIDLYGNILKTQKNKENTHYDLLNNQEELFLDKFEDSLDMNLDNVELSSDNVQSEIPKKFINKKQESIQENFNEESLVEEVSNTDICEAILDIENKNKRKNRNRIIIGVVLSALVSFGGTFSYILYTDYKAEQLRLSELNKDDLKLKIIVDTVDEYGEYDYQLNWKEIASVLSVQENNYTENITKDKVLAVCSLFLDKENGLVKDLDSVVKSLDLSSKQKQRVYDYNEDLIEFGYTPEKLKLDSPQMQFINSIKEGAFESYRKTQILPSITIAQAILESNWGNSNLAKESNNLFGIKADSSWKGDFVTFETKEFHDMMIKDKFRKYSSVSESIMDHSEFLKANSRYENGGVFKAKTYKAQAYALQESGYSTAQDEYGNKTYASMLETLIRQYNLQIFDWEVKHFNS